MSYEVLEPTEDDSCQGSRRSSFLFNGHQFAKDLIDSSPEWGVYSLQSHLISQTAATHEDRELEIYSNVSCVHGTSLKPKTDALEPLDAHSDIEVTSFRIGSIDGRPSRSNCGLTFSFNRASRQIVGLWPAPDAVEVDVNGDTDTSRAPAEDNHETQPTIDDEIKRLRLLQDHLNELKQVVGEQKTLVNGLTKDKVVSARQELKQCKDVKCVLKTLVDKAKGCAHIVYLRFGPHEPSQVFDHPMAGQKHMNIHPSMPSFQQCSSSDGDLAHSCSQPAHPYRDGYSKCSNHSSDPRTILYTTLSVIAGFLCVGCICTIVHYHCSNPRVRADRAARREERQTRRQYRCLAKRKEWKDWWNRRIHRNTAASSSDYEEKRSLILAQEAVLENAMQYEIGQLRRQHGVNGDMINAAEEGRSSPSRTESRPPSYRSRTSSGSGRPPSYHSNDDDDDSRGRGRSGRYTPAGSDFTPGGSDFTPDSSVAGVSPRNSSDTLRTELSGLL